ncbi:MAG: ATP-binding cassette domain-containing protein, partial [Lentisphaeria bacterium]
MIEFRQVRKAFGTQLVLDEASFTVFPGERVGLVGPNGAGKSTVAALLTGDLSTDKGEVLLPRTLRLGVLRQQLDLREIPGTLLEFAEDGLPELRRIEAEIQALESGLDRLDTAARESTLKRLGVLQTEFEHLGGYE